MKQLTIFLIAVCVLTISNAQISLNGPEGCDATYFYKSKVGFWLGTGSSGGILVNAINIRNVMPNLKFIITNKNEKDSPA